MAAKEIDPLGDGINPQSLESGAQDWAMKCGVCHVGGGQLEYDRDMGNYGRPETPTGDRYMWKRASLAGPGQIVEGPLSATNKAEVDCLMCHMNGSKNGQAWLQTMGCSDVNPLGPSNDKNCDGNADPGYPPAFMVPTAGSFPAGTAYDMFNRNAGIKQGGNFAVAASMGIGARGLMNQFGQITGVTGVPSTITKAAIAYTPPSASCSVCHARDDSQTGLPGMMAMKYGYGNYNMISPPGSELDTDTGSANVNLWFELGCKTGMGKRAHRVGAGPNNRWGMSMFVTSTFDGSCNHADRPCMGDPIPNKMPDADVHDINDETLASTGMACGSCHYALGSSRLQGGSVTISGGDHHGVVYPEETILGSDHLFAQGDSSPDTKGKNNLDGTVTCESCHTTFTHPGIELVGGKYFMKNSTAAGTAANPASDPGLLVPAPTHSGFEAVHIQKIACTTCHIPDVYAAPGRLKYRDWTVGEYKGGFRNMLDWNYDLVTGSHNTVPVLHAWITKFGEKKIYPILPAELPIWYKSSVNSLTEAGSDTPAPDGYPTASPLWAPVKHRDTTAAALAVKAAHPEFDIRINGGNIVPLFDGFSLSDSWEIDTKAELDAFTDPSLIVEGSRFADKLRVYHTNFDVTHGVAPKEFALGGANKGGCVSCHSSANPRSPYYSAGSVAFFESYQQPLNKAGQGIGQYDLVKNWFAIFADYDCTAMVNGLCSSNENCMAMCTMQMGYDAATCTGFCSQAPTACVNFPFSDNPATPDKNLFNSMTGAPVNNPFLGACVGQMAQGFDVMMGFPAGTANMMGMYDGIAGLQGFTIRETVSGSTLDCNPFTGPVSFSQIPGQLPPDYKQTVNHCIPDPSQPAPAPGYPTGAMYAGTCEGSVPPMPGMCSGGFRDGGPCMGPTNVDCEGALASPMPLLYSRGEARSHFKINLQQSGTGPAAKVTWPIVVEQNPSNPAHVASWDQAQKCVDMLGMPTTCTDGAAIKTTVDGNDFLGYTPQYKDYLMALVLNPAPCDPAVAYFTPSEAGMTITFDPTASLRATSYSWNFGDGATATSTPTDPPIVHTYQAVGTYNVKLTAYGACGVPSERTVTITIGGSPVAYFTAVLIADNTVQFDGTPSVNEDSYLWNFGDPASGANNSSTDANPTHTFSAAGTYTVTLTVTNSQGTSTRSMPITVGKLQPICYFSPSYDPADPTKRTIIFNASKTKYAVSYAWEFGDTTTGADVITTHQYTAPGTYTVRLTATGLTGMTCTKSMPITIR